MFLVALLVILGIKRSIRDILEPFCSINEEVMAAKTLTLELNEVKNLIVITQ